MNKHKSRRKHVEVPKQEAPQERGPEAKSKRGAAQLLSAEWLTALGTCFLAVFAFFAWRESVRTTRAIEGQLSAMRDELRAKVAILAWDIPRYDGEHSAVWWNVYYKNVGKQPAYNFRSFGYIKVGGEEFHLDEELKGLPPVEGTQLNPEEQQFVSVTRRNITEERFNELKKTTGAMGVMIEFHYQTEKDGPDTSERFCGMLGSNGTVEMVGLTICPKASSDK